MGLILSSEASRYLALAKAQNSEFDALCCHEFTEIQGWSDSVRASIEWVLADPGMLLPVWALLPNVRWAQSTWAGVERLLAYPRQNYVLTNVRGVFAPLITEYVLAHCLAHERQLYAHRDAFQRRLWLNARDQGANLAASVGRLHGKTMLILGLGSIGSGLAQCMAQFGVTILGIAKHSRSAEQKAGVVSAVGTLEDAPALLCRADYVVNTLPNTPLTQGIIDAQFLACMPQHAVLINVGRGQAVVEADLAQALRAGVIAHAVLDVYCEEPLPESHEFWQTPNLTLTSHTAAPSVPEDVFQVFWSNYQRFIRDMPLECVVNFEKGY